MAKIVLLDGSSLAFRAFYGLHDLNRFKNKSGLHTNALYAFHLMLTTTLEREKPDHILVAWDAGKTTFRTDKYEAYKGGRDSMPEELREQWPSFNVLLDAFGITHYQLDQYEADDIIGTMAKKAEEEGYDVVVLSGDKDLTQLASEKIRVDITRKGVTEVEAYTPETVKEKWGITPEQIIDMKGLMGDASDNYPGVTGIGKKTAAQLIQQFGSVEGVYDNLEAVSGKKRVENLKNDKDLAFLSKDLARIITNAPIEVSLEDTIYQGKDLSSLRRFYEQMNFNRFLNELTENSEENKAPQTSFPYVEVKEDEFPTELLRSDQPLAFYMEMLESNYHEGEVKAYVISDNKKAYVGKPEAFENHPEFKAWIEDETKEKWTFDVKRTTLALAYRNLALKGVKEDVLIGAYLTYAKDFSEDLALIAQVFDLDLPLDLDVYGKGAKRKIPEKEAFYAHLAQKAKTITALVPILEKRLKKDQHLTLYRDMELPLAQVLIDMEKTGISVKEDVLTTLKEDYDKRLEAIQDQIFEEVGHDFNLNSTQQLSDVLYGEMNLPHGKKLKGRSGDDHIYYSTSQKELDKLRGLPLIDKIVDYRQLAKLQSTYLESLKDFIHEDGRIHTRFIQTLTATGRLSSADPNLQNIPIRTEEGRLIRKAFVSNHPGWKLFSFDYSQIELRVLAHISGDENLREAFIENKDIHRATASRILNKPEEDITSNDRRSAKAVNFGIVYGISDYGLSQNLHISRKAAKAFIENYFKNFPKVQKFMKDIVTVAEEKGYVETLFHRRRDLPDIHSSNFNLRSFAQRTAMNSPIQGSAADIIKIAMVRMAQALKEKKMKTKILLQIHDELIFEVPKEEEELLTSLAHEVMENAVKLSVPLIVDGNSGETWYDAK